jgi:hypothetical protein
MRSPPRLLKRRIPQVLQVRFPDQRNELAAVKLKQLSVEIEDLSDSSWEELEKHYSLSSPRFFDAVSEVSRSVVFRGINTLEDFVSRLLFILSKQSVAA